MSEQNLEQSIDYLALFIQGLGQFSGVFLGVIAGTAVTILAQKWLTSQSEQKQLNNFKFELELNSKKIEEWLTELGKYRNAVNGDSLLNYFGYFRFSSFIGVIASQLHGSGAIYKHLSHDHIGQLQIIYNELSLQGENILNNKIEQRKQSLANLNNQNQGQIWQSTLKQEVVNDINFWEEKLNGHTKTIDSIIESIS